MSGARPGVCAAMFTGSAIRFMAGRLKSIHAPKNACRNSSTLLYATRNLYFFTLYNGTNGMRIGTVRTYFRYSGSAP